MIDAPVSPKGHLVVRTGRFPTASGKRIGRVGNFRLPNSVLHWARQAAPPSDGSKPETILHGGPAKLAASPLFEAVSSAAPTVHGNIEAMRQEHLQASPGNHAANW